MQYGAVFGTRSRYARLRNEGLYPSKAFAPMQYGHEIGHAPAMLAFVMKDCIHRRRSLQCSMDMKSGTLSLTSPS